MRFVLVRKSVYLLELRRCPFFFSHCRIQTPTSWRDFLLCFNSKGCAPVQRDLDYTISTGQTMWKSSDKCQSLQLLACTQRVNVDLLNCLHCVFELWPLTINKFLVFDCFSSVEKKNWQQGLNLLTVDCLIECHCFSQRGNPGLVAMMQLNIYLSGVNISILTRACFF